VATNIVSTSVVSGLSDAEAAKKLAAVDRAYKMRRYGPDKVAKQIVKAVKKGKSVVPVTPEAHLQYRFSRFAPALGRLAAAKASLG
jgi:hypothetical protein